MYRAFYSFSWTLRNWKEKSKLAEEARTNDFDDADAVQDGCIDAVEGEADDVADYDIDEVTLNRGTSDTVIGMQKIITKVRTIAKYIKNLPKAKGWFLYWKPEWSSTDDPPRRAYYVEFSLWNDIQIY